LKMSRWGAGLRLLCVLLLQVRSAKCRKVKDGL